LRRRLRSAGRLALCWADARFATRHAARLGWAPTYRDGPRDRSGTRRQQTSRPRTLQRTSTPIEPILYASFRLDARQCRRRFAARLCVLLGGFGLGVVTLPPAYASDLVLPTTVDLNGVGSGAFQGAYGVQHPRNMDFAPIPIGYTLTASGTHWTGWGSATAIGTGDVEYCPNMSPCTSGTFTLRLSERSFVRCPSGRSHYGYTRMNLDLVQEGGGDWGYRVLVGCSRSA
jgi:hypothetical protein